MFCEKKSIPTIPLPTTPRSSLTYEDVVKELIHDVKQHQRNLHMIIWVFREELAKCVREPRELDLIFPHIFDIYDVTVTLLGALEDVIEMSQEQSPPCVGSCFEGKYFCPLEMIALPQKFPFQQNLTWHLFYPNRTG